MRAAHRMEIVNPGARRGGFRCALLDFDGTLSLVRAGWQDVMAEYFAGELLRAPACREAHSAADALVRDFIVRLNGKPTIHQCERLADEVRARGGSALAPEEYKAEYLRRLGDVTAERLGSLADGSAEADSLLVPGARAFLQALTDRGVVLYLASGTDLVYVRQEVGVLDLGRFFGERVYGAGEGTGFSKGAVLAQMLAETGARGDEALVVGDGHVETVEGKAAGALVVGVASDETGAGGLDADKRDLLAASGADLIVADYTCAAEVLAYLFC